MVEPRAAITLDSRPGLACMHNVIDIDGYRISSTILTNAFSAGTVPALGSNRPGMVAM